MPPAPGAGTSAPARNIDRLFEFCVIGMVASGYLAVAGSGYLDTATVLLTAAALLLRSLMSSGLLRLPLSPMVVHIATLLYIGFYPIDYLYVSREFLPATVHLVFFLAITKVLTASTDRDFAYLKIVAFLELMAASILNGHANFFVFLALFLIFAVGTFSSSEIRRSAHREVRVVRAGFRGLQYRLVAIGLCLSLGVLTMTAGLFFFLPRTARAAFRHLISERYHLPGFSSEITLGQIGEIKSQGATVMHIRFISQWQPPNLKWRGVALGNFDGKRWYNEPGLPYENIQTVSSGMAQLIDDGRRPPLGTRRILYEVQQKDFGADTLFFAGIPEFVYIASPFVRRSPSGGIRMPLGLRGSVTYQAHTFLEADRPEIAPLPLVSMQRKEYLSLPPLDPRIPRLAREVSALAKSPEARARAIEQHLRREYGYTLSLLRHEVSDPLAHFLFERRKGHCEYFASAMAVMLRTIDIPSRVVTGFQSGVFNPISGLQLIRTSDAHSWVEAYIPNLGWTTFDPTPPDPVAAYESVWSRFSLYLDAAETFWQDWVLNYDLDHQLLLATRVQDSSARGSSWTEGITFSVDRIKRTVIDFLKHYGAPLAAGLIVVAVVIIYGPALRKAWTHRRRLRRVQRGQVDASDATILYTRMLRFLERRGLEKPAWITPSEFARGLPASEMAPLVEDLTDAYQQLRYGGRREAGPRMLRLLEQLERS